MKRTLRSHLEAVPGLFEVDQYYRFHARALKMVLPSRFWDYGGELDYPCDIHHPNIETMDAEFRSLNRADLLERNRQNSALRSVMSKGKKKGPKKIKSLRKKRLRIMTRWTFRQVRKVSADPRKDTQGITFFSVSVSRQFLRR